MFQNIREYGAKGDGIANDTAAIQRALDAGGAVYVPPGVYKTGTLYLRSDGGLELAAGAVLLASPDPADYNAPDFCVQNGISKAEKAFGGHLIVALECENVFLRGRGKIDGNRPAFFDPLKISRADFNGYRPSQMLFFCESRRIEISGLELVNSPYWCCFLHGCENVQLRGLQIDNQPKESWNGDGIDIDCCTNVTVSDCIVRASDDCICVRAAGAQRLRFHKEGISENIVITNCIVMQGHCGVRIGVGTGTIRHCCVSNIVTRDTWYGFGIHSSYLRNGYPQNSGCQVEDICLSNFNIDSRSPFYIVSDCFGIQPDSPKQVRGIHVSNIRARAERNALLRGNMDGGISDVAFSDVALLMFGGKGIFQEMPHAERIGRDSSFGIPCGMYVNNIRNLALRNVVMQWENETAPRRAALEIGCVQDLRMENCRFDPPAGGVDILKDK